ncbi:MAG: type II secretion system F family protein [Pseudomonadota bacterium]
MAAYRYRAMDEAGKTQAGMVEATNPVAARLALRGKGLLPMELVASAQAVPANKALTSPKGVKISGAALTLATRQMATLLRSGLRIEEALATIASGQPPRVAGVLLTVRASVLEGRSLGAALGAYPLIFSDFYRASVRAGEASGRLDQVMTHLAAFVESRARNRQTVQLALLYPALLGVVSLGIITLLMVFVVPDIVKVFRDRGADLPLLTRALIGISAAIRLGGVYVLAGIVLGSLAFAQWSRRPANRLLVDRVLAKARLTRRLVQRMNAAQFAGTLATLLLSRVPLAEALVAAADVTPNRHIRAAVTVVTDKVRQGMSLHRAMTEAQVFPPMMVAMVASGEASGDLGTALDHAATEQQRDLDAWVRAMVALVEPAILLIMGGLVMAMVLAILLPIMSLNGLADG